MLWLDNVLTLPMIGLKTVPNLRAALRGPQVLANFIDSQVQTRGEVNVTQGTAFDYTVRVPDGFSLTLQVDNLLGRFVYPPQKVTRPGHITTLTEPTLRPYSALLDETQERLQSFVESLELQTVQLQRIGIVAAAAIDGAAPPPGVVKLMGHLAKPWKVAAVELHARVLVDLEKSDERHTRCFHTLQYQAEVPENGVQLTLDWQKVFAEPKTVRMNALCDLMKNCIEEAKAYFQRFGEGDLDYGEE